MADVEAAIREIREARALLVGRFGHDRDVLGHLALALGYLHQPDEERVAAGADLPVPADEAPAAAEPEPEATEVISPPPAEPPSAPARSKRAGRRRRQGVRA